MYGAWLSNPALLPGLDSEAFIHGAVLEIEHVGIVNTLVSADHTSLGNRGLDEVPTIEGSGSGPIVRVGNFSGRVRSLSIGEISGRRLSTGTIGDWFSLHSPTTLFCSPVRQCIFISMNKPCRFCTYEGGRIEKLPVEAFGNGLSMICKQSEGITSIAIGGGTPDTRDMGVQYFSELAAVASARGLAVSVETVPPPSLTSLDTLKEAGVTSLIMSLEVWNAIDRARWCLGKGLVDREHYIAAWTRGVELFGRGNVTSVLLVGTESLESTMDGAAKMVDMGVIPALLPLRRYATSRFSEDVQLTALQYVQVSERLGRLLSSQGLDPRLQLGCTACGGCSMENHFAEVTQRSRVIEIRSQ